MSWPQQMTEGKQKSCGCSSNGTPRPLRSWKPTFSCSNKKCINRANNSGTKTSPQWGIGHTASTTTAILGDVCQVLTSCRDSVSTRTKDGSPVVKFNRKIVETRIVVPPVECTDGSRPICLEERLMMINAAILPPLVASCVLPPAPGVAIATSASSLLTETSPPRRAARISAQTSHRDRARSRGNYELR
ncbi:hypothetical protein J6590_010062 [Homalodisca vitripennis]|nr:hypothetical protein J6590_010062 [Homalodisca vitripennis]